MFKILNREYPAPTSGTRSLIIAVVFGVFIGLFLLFFEPFDINLSTYKNKTLTVLFYGIITSFVLFLFLYLFPLWFPNFFSDERWQVKHQIIYYLTILFTIATLNGIYTNYINSLEFSWTNYWWIINRTIILGGIPISFLIIVDYNRKLNLYLKEARDIGNNRLKPKHGRNENIWKISTDLKNETFKVDENNFLFAVAIGNYIDVYTTDEDVIKKTTYRITLSSFEKQLGSNYLARCHRSYLINLGKVADISGNAQGLRLRPIDCPEIVPVSRKYIPTIKKYFSQVSKT